MKTELVKVSQVQMNQANPRTITESDFEKLVNSILMLPKMLELRPVVVDNTFTALGGNMRSKALQYLAELKDFELVDRLRGLNGYKKKAQAEQQALEKYWCDWLLNPVCPVVKATNLTDEEKQEFIIKDNGSFGKWDFDALANQWDIDDLNDWSCDLAAMLPSSAYDFSDDNIDNAKENDTADVNLCKCPECGHIANKSEFAYINK